MKKSAHKIVLHSFLLVVFCFAPLFNFSQEDTLKDKTEIIDFYISGGPTNFPIFSISQNEFKKMVPGSKILSGNIMSVNFNDFDHDSAGGFSRGGSATAAYLQAGVTLRLKNKEFKKAGPWLKLGLNYFSTSSFLNTGVFRRITLNDDSLYTVNAMPVSRTIVNKQTVTYQYSSQSINFEGTLIYKLNPEGIFSLFGGPGAFVGANFAGKAKLISTRDSITRDYLVMSASQQIFYKEETRTSVVNETFSINPNLAFGLFVNIGVDLRLGNKYEYIKDTHFFAEIKPMFRAYAIKGAGLQGSTLLAANFGLRYQFE